MPVAAAERQGFVVTGFGQRRTFCLKVNVAELSNGMREPERLVQLAEDGGGFFVMLRLEHPPAL